VKSVDNLLLIFSRLFCQTDRRERLGSLRIILVLYASLLALVISRHEPWFDEAQAWLLARDLSLGDLLFHRIRYEGTPALWHLLLMIPAKLGLPYFSLHIVSGTMAVISVYVFLRHSPFPLFFKITLPFTFFTFYQYAVIARSYCLIPLFLGFLAITYRRRHTHPWAFLFILIVFSHISLHTALLAGGFFVMTTGSIVWSWSKQTLAQRQQFLKICSCFALNTLIIILIVAPPPDITFSPITSFSSLRAFLNCASMLNQSIVTWLPASASLWLAFLYYFKRQQKLTIYLLPLGLVFLLVGFRYASPWHEGILVCWLLFVLWISLDSSANATLPAVASLALAVMILCHLNWTIKTATWDYQHTYSGSRAAADYLKANHGHAPTMTAYGFACHALSPYFSHNLFSNNPDPSATFYAWSPKAIPDPIPQPFKPSADFVLIAWKSKNQNLPPIPSDYNLEAVFPGAIFWKTAPLEADTYIFLRRTEKTR
jgi:hypothetical protein